MSGIYIHIPYCAQACHYCDFHFSVNRQNKAEMLEMIGQEIVLQKDYLPDNTISTLYFGGGTPSILEEKELSDLMRTLEQQFHFHKEIEITLEANPEDLTMEKLKVLKSIGVNRLSIGIQTFDEKQLQYLNRSHNAQEAEQAVRMAQDVGIQNISIDLIYGIPSENHAVWESDLHKAFSLGVPHISSYCLTIEPATVFGRRLSAKKLAPENEDYNAAQYERLVQMMEENAFEQYEVSNFCKEGFYSKHNSNYWHNQSYLGLGPSAHSYNGESRQYNSRSNGNYIKSIKNGIVPFTLEVLDTKTKANEYIMTKLRTKWGIDYQVLKDKFDMPLEEIKKVLTKNEKLGNLTVVNTQVNLTKKGLMIADKITEDLFFI